MSKKNWLLLKHSDTLMPFHYSLHFRVYVGMFLLRSPLHITTACFGHTYFQPRTLQFLQVSLFLVNYRFVYYKEYDRLSLISVTHKHLSDSKDFQQLQSCRIRFNQTKCRWHPFWPWSCLINIVKFCLRNEVRRY